MRLKELEGELQPLYGFDGPDGSSSSKRELEQFVTSAHLASRMLVFQNLSLQIQELIHDVTPTGYSLHNLVLVISKAREY